MMGFVLATLGPALLVSGLIFPSVLCWLSSQGKDPYGSQLGILLAVNGVGGLVGVEMVQHAVMPLLGVHGAMGVVGMVYGMVSLSLALALRRKGARVRTLWVPGTALGIITVLLVGKLLYLPLIHPRPTQKISFKTLSIAAGPEGVVAVTESDELGRGIVMYNQYVLGSTRGLFDEQRQAHLPILLHPQPSHVGFIGVATGITAGSALVHDEVEELTAIELSDLVAQASQRYFSDVNNQLFEDPRARILVEDGRIVIAACPEQFDVLIGDLFLPWRPGIGRLYSLEHFASCKQALRSGGLFCQLIPAYQFNQTQLEVLIHTLLQVFSTLELFSLEFDTETPVLALIGFRDSKLQWDHLGARCAHLRSKGVIVDPVLRHPEGLAMLYVGRLSTPVNAQSPINTLAHPRIELQAGLELVTGKWKQGTFLKGRRWLNISQLLKTQVSMTSSLHLDIEAYSKLGLTLTQWDLLCREEAAGAGPLGRKIYQNLPDVLKEDQGMDTDTWLGWSALLQPPPLGPFNP